MRSRTHQSDVTLGLNDSMAAGQEGEAGEAGEAELQRKSSTVLWLRRILIFGLALWLPVTYFIFFNARQLDAKTGPGEQTKAETEVTMHAENVADKVVTPEAAERAKLDSILDELMAAHRHDVKTREASADEPEDLPVYSSDRSLVVTMADGGYAACATRLVKSVRDAGRWGGPVLLLVPTGDDTQAFQRPGPLERPVL